MKKLEKKKNKENGFVILISIMVSLILLSVGIFIATIAVREIMLSSSVKQSQRAFFAADTVLECALFKEFKKGGFSNTKYTTHNTDNSLRCNGWYFDWESSATSGSPNDITTHIYYISLVPKIDSEGHPIAIDTDSDIILSKGEIVVSEYTKNQPYVKLIIKKENTGAGVDTTLRVFGHNFREGKSIIERALEVKY